METILYIGGFQLPEKNAAAQRVIGIAKGFRDLGHEVIFLNSLKDSDKSGVLETAYFGFPCYEYKREPDTDYLLSAKTTLSMIQKVQPDAVVAYNYPAVSLNRIRSYCQSNGIRCFADATEWYDAVGDSRIAGIIKGLDTSYRMKCVHKKLDGVIAISRYLYDYYSNSVNTVLIPPTVDITDEKWDPSTQKETDCVSFVYAGSPSAGKEQLDKIVRAVGLVEKKKQIRLDIVGITQDQFVSMYAWTEPVPKSVVFWGRVSHQDALRAVKQAHWAIILREDNRMVKAGFPTKLVESISCGTPVMANRFSNVFDYLTDENSIYVEKPDDLASCVIQACGENRTVDRRVFDYHNFLPELEKLRDAR